MRSLFALLIGWGLMATTVSAQGVGSEAEVDRYPLIVLAVGMASVLGLIIGLRMNAFLAMIISALLVSLMVVGDEGFELQEAGNRMNAVVSAFGSSAGGVGIVIAMAAIIGKCMLDSGSADRIVQAAVAITGVKRASIGLMASGFILAVPVFFDTVFYLLVPLARSLFKKTQRNYLRFLMAITTGGVLTHALVPPTPGPLLVGANLGVDIGTMMWVGTLVALPAAVVGLAFSYFVDSVMPVPMRPLGPHQDKHDTLTEQQRPSLWVSLLPILLPVFMIGAGTLATTLADKEDRAQLSVDDLKDAEALQAALRTGAADVGTPAARFLASETLTEQDRAILTGEEALAGEGEPALVAALNRGLLSRSFYDEQAFLGISVSPIAKRLLAEDQVRLKPVLRRRMNRVLLEDTFPGLIKPHVWESPQRRWANRLSLFGNANFALLLAALTAILTLKVVRGLTLRQLAGEIEEALMSGGMIILITAAGGAFGAMLQDAAVGDTVRSWFAGSRGGGVMLILLAFAISAVLKTAQGSSTVAMIVASGMVAGIVSGQTLAYHPVYLATSVGAGALMGSWMNDSGFWVFAKMGVLTEGEALRSWTLLLGVLALSCLLSTILLSLIMPMAG